MIPAIPDGAYKLMGDMQKENIRKKIHMNKGCFGCGACKNICPVDAIEMEYDDEGYLIPAVISEKCIECGKCLQICPVLNNEQIATHYDYDQCTAFAAWAPIAIRMKCSSGGAAHIFSNYMIENGGMVYGAVWNDDFSCSIRGSSSPTEIEEQRYSKYLQSNTELTFREVKRRINNKERVLYIGVPCQIAGLNRYLGELRESDYLITIDLVCSHSPSVLYFQKYLSENYSDVKSITFRSKKDFGWSCDGHVIEHKSGYINKCVSSTDPYQSAYHGFVMRRQICEECSFAGFPRQGDITIGDFWGIGYEDPSWDDHYGTSLIIANSNKGAAFIKHNVEFFERIEEVPLRWARNKGNRINNDCRKGHKNARYFTRLLKNNTFEKAVDAALSDKHDIGLLCYSNRNYGNNLTNYALYQYLNDCGYSVLMINTAKDSFFNQDIYFGDGFIENPYYVEDLSERLYGAEYVNYNDRCELFCVGSDQLFRENFVEGMDYAPMLKFAYSYKFKFSYGTSFGSSKYVNCESLRLKASHLLSRFQAVSVREKAGIEILKEKLGIENPMHVVDPIFLVDSSIYHEMADIGKARIGNGGFVGAYFLDPNDTKEKILQAVVAEKGLEDIVILDRETYAYKYYKGSMHVIEDPKVEEWLALIRGSDLFLTDSFHGVCFALIFQKDFYVLFEKDNWRGVERISEFLGEIGLLDRLIILEESTNLKYTSINYKSVKDDIEKKVCISKKWVDEILKMAKSYKGRPDYYDVLLDDFSYNRLMNTELKKQLCTVKADLFLWKRNRNLRQGGGSSMEIQRIIGFGIGNCLERNIKTVLQTCNVSYLTDNDPDKWGKEYYGIECIPPSKIAGFADAFVIIFIDDVGTSFTILRQLNSMGIYSVDHINNYLNEVVLGK